jgi:hypothetical protein
MVGRVKTTINIADALLDEARRQAQSRHTTLRELIHEGLRSVIERQRQEDDLRLISIPAVEGGLSPGFRDAAWGRIREAAYRGRGV